MRNEKDKDLEQLIANELMNDLGIDEEKMLSRLRFKEKTPWYKNYKIFIPAVSFCMLCLLVLTSVLSITIYKSYSEIYANNEDIIFEALDAFEEEIDDFDLYKRINLHQVDNSLVCGIYYYNGNEKIICYVSKNQSQNIYIEFNNNVLNIDSNVEMFDVSLIQNNKLIIYKNNIEIFNLNFTN